MVFCTPAENKYTDTEHCPYTKNKLMHNLIILMYMLAYKKITMDKIYKFLISPKNELWVNKMNSFLKLEIRLLKIKIIVFQIFI